MKRIYPILMFTKNLFKFFDLDKNNFIVLYQEALVQLVKCKCDEICELINSKEASDKSKPLTSLKNVKFDAWYADLPKKLDIVIRELRTRENNNAGINVNDIEKLKSLVNDDLLSKSSGNGIEVKTIDRLLKYTCLKDGDIKKAEFVLEFVFPLCFINEERKYNNMLKNLKQVVNAKGVLFIPEYNHRTQTGISDKDTSGYYSECDRKSLIESVRSFSGDVNQLGSFLVNLSSSLKEFCEVGVPVSPNADEDNSDSSGVNHDTFLFHKQAFKYLQIAINISEMIEEGYVLGEHYLDAVQKTLLEIECSSTDFTKNIFIDDLRVKKKLIIYLHNSTCFHDGFHQYIGNDHREVLL